MTDCQVALLLSSFIFPVGWSGWLMSEGYVKLEGIRYEDPPPTAKQIQMMRVKISLAVGLLTLIVVWRLVL